MAKITITELVLRDGHQSLLATRMRLKDMNAWLVQFLIRPESDEDDERQAATSAAVIHHRRCQS